MGYIHCNIDKIVEFCNKCKPKLITKGFVYDGIFYMSNDLCSALINYCIECETDQPIEWIVREPNAYENADLPHNFGDIIDIRCDIQEDDFEVSGSYIVTQDGSFILKTNNMNDVTKIDADVLSFVHNVTLLFKTFQQTINKVIAS